MDSNQNFGSVVKSSVWNIRQNFIINQDLRSDTERSLMTKSTIRYKHKVLKENIIDVDSDPIINCCVYSLYAGFLKRNSHDMSNKYD